MKHKYNYNGPAFHIINDDWYYYAINDNNKPIIFNEDTYAESPEEAIRNISYRLMKRYDSSRYPTLLEQYLHMVSY